MLSKPFTRSELLSRVRHALDGPTANDGAANTQG
jgi:hypothetical protein